MSVAFRIRAWPRAAATGAAIAVFLAGGNNGAPHHDGTNHYQAGVMADPRFEASVSFTDDGWAVQAVPSAAAIGWAPAEPAKLDQFTVLYWRDAAIEVDRIKDGVVTRRLTGTIAAATVSDGKLIITCSDLTKILDKPVTAASFAGTGGIEGGDFAIGRTKRRSFGRVWNVEGRLLDKVNNIYEFGDPAFPLQGCTALRDMGRAGPLGIIAWQGSIAATLNALKAATPERGGGLFAPSIACAKWWTQPAGPLTADLQGEAAGYAETAAGIASQLLGLAQGPAVSNLAAANALRPAACGLHIGDNSETTATALNRLLQSVTLGWRLTPAGTVEIWNYTFTGPVETLNATFISRESTIQPVKSRQVGYKKNERVHGDGEISAAVQASDVVYEDGTTAEEWKPAEQGATNGASSAEKSQLAQLASDTATAQTNIAAAQAQIVAIQSSVSADVSSLTSQIGAVSANVTTLSGTVGSVSANLSDLVAKVGTINTSTGTLAQQVGTVTTSVSTLQGQVGTVSGDLDSLEALVATQGGTIASHTSQISAANANISTNATAINTANSNIAGLTTRVSSAESSITSNATALTNLTGRTATLETTVSSQGASISSLQSTTSTQGGDIATLTTQIVAGGGNLLTNPDFAIDASGWAFATGNGSSGGRNLPDAQWYPTTENVLTTILASTTTTGQGDWTQTIALEAGKWYDVSAFAASHRANIQLYLQFLDTSGAVLATASSGLIAPSGGGNSLSAFTLRSFKAQAPAGTVSGKLIMRKFGTLSGTDSYAWFLRPQVAETTAAKATPVPYSPGSARASISSQATAISTLDTQYASLSSTVSTQGTTIASQATAITNLTGRTATLETTVSSQGANISTLQSTTTTQGGSIATLQSQMSTANTNISSNATAISTANGNIASLTTRVSSAESAISTQASSITTLQGTTASLSTLLTTATGNLIQNSELSPSTEGWVGYTNQTGIVFSLNGMAADYLVAGINALTIQQPNAATTGYAEWRQMAIPLEPNNWYDISGWCLAHRCTVQIYLQWRLADGSTGTAPGSGTLTPAIGGTTLNSWTRFAFKTQAPANIVAANLLLRKLPTNTGTDSFAAFCRPQLRRTTSDASAGLPYAPSGNAASVSAVLNVTQTQAGQIATLNTGLSTASANISSNATAITTANANIASLTTRVSSAEGTISSQATAITNLQGTTASLSTTVSSQGASISALQSITSTQGGQISTLTTTVSASATNLFSAGSFAAGLSGWTMSGGSWVASAISDPNWGRFVSSTGVVPSYARSAVQAATPSQSYTISADIDRGGSTGGLVAARIIWTNNGADVSIGPTASKASGSFSNSEADRVFGTGACPASGVNGFYVQLVVEGISSSATSYFRRVKVNVGTTPSRYSEEASLAQSFTAISTLDTQYASLSSTVSTQGTTIASQATAITNLTGRTATLESTVSTQGASITSLQSTTTTQGGDIATLKTQVVAGGGNLLTNTDFAVDASGWTFSTGNGSTGGRNLPDAQWYPATESVLTTILASTTATGQGDWTQTIALEAGKWYDVSAYAASHRANIQFYLQFLDASGVVLATASSGSIAPSGGGNSLSAFTVRSFKAQAPTGTVSGKFFMRKFGTLSGTDSYAWFLRPQVAETTSAKATPVPYSPGSARVSISTQATAISTLGAQYASLSSTVSTQGTTIASQATAITNLTGRTATLETTVSSQGASISSLQSTTSTLSGSVATLTTSVNATAPNLVPYGSFAAGSAGWTTDAGWAFAAGTDPNWGAFATVNVTSGNRYASTAVQPATPGQNYTISVDIDRGGTTGGTVGARIIWTNNGSQAGFGPAALKSSGGFSNDETGRVWASGVCPASGVNGFFVQLLAEGVTGSQYWRRLKVNMGAGPARYSDEASASQSFQALSTLTTQYASLSSTVATQGVSITSQATAITTLQGNVTTLFAQWVLDVQVGNIVAGIKLANNGGATSLKFRSDLVEFTGSTSTARAEFRGGTWFGYDDTGRKRYQIGNLALS